MKKLIYTLFLLIFLTTSCGVAKNVERITVASQQADCMGVAPQKCLLIKSEGKTDWTFWYTGIEGFDYEQGYEYVIEIKKDTVKLPPADRSTINYVFVKEVSKTQKESENLPQIRP